MNERQEQTHSILVQLKQEVEEIRDSNNGCEQQEQIQLMHIVHALGDLCRTLDGTLEPSSNVPVVQPIDVPLQLPYKEARMQVMHKFQAAYCSAYIRMHGGKREAATAAKVELSNFYRILRMAINSLRQSVL